MSALIEKIRKARESTVEVNGRKFTIRRPTEAEQAELFGGGKVSALEIVRRFTVGWDLQEMDLFNGGNPVPVAFDADVWREYVNDVPELWEPLADAIINVIKAHREKVEGAAKK